ncbi:MAG: hypothetical protein R3E31_22785 [Chloroflexota bacterium]
MSNDLDELWEQFETAVYETRIQLFQQALDHPDIDGEWAFEMLNELYEQAAANQERDRFDGLVNDLRTKVPAAYATEAGYMLEWLITNALVNGRSQALPDLVQELAEYTADVPEIIVNVADQLAYYGQLAPLVTLCNLAWPHIQSSPDIDEWVIEEFAVHATNYIILHYLETAVSPTATDPDLQAQLDHYVEFEADALAEHMAQITGQETRTWNSSDFATPKGYHDTEIPESVERNVTHLLRTFVHHLQTEKDIPTSRAGLAYWPLAELLFAHIEDQLTSYQPKQKQKGPYRKTAVSSPLLPVPNLLDQFLESMIDLISPQYYRAAALVNVLPAWLDFLTMQGVVSTEQSAQMYKQYAAVIGQLQQQWHQEGADPALAASLRVWKA